MESPENQQFDEETTEKTLPEINEDSVAISPDSVLYKNLPLKCNWKFWYLDGEKNKEWMDRLHDLCVLTTVEEFWALIDRIRKPSNLPQCDYSLFKESIPPVWEERDNKSGGRIVYQLAKTDHELFNELWLKLMLGMIGDFFGDATDAICGAVCSSRPKGSKISIWTQSGADQEVIKRIGVLMRDLWANHYESMEKARIFYESHADSQNKQSSVAPHRQYLTGHEYQQSY
ncbi:hypothetical protein M3Y94_00837500 [Aphelenchoides besseyi]|nr:hypothetical protein M3Y94_00837500 [Aphelenchoides besseyi]KAI6226954.1 Eukaryotic translation initiation factor 4E type 1B [Aphelenchoides besseyi]